MNTNRKLRVGDRVRIIVGIAPGVKDKYGLKTRTIWKKAIGHTFVVRAFDRLGYPQLNLGRMIGERAWEESFWIEPEYLKLVRRRKPGQKTRCF